MIHLMRHLGSHLLATSPDLGRVRKCLNCLAALVQVRIRPYSKIELETIRQDSPEDSQPMREGDGVNIVAF